jgi:hypothetical protein
MNANPGKRHARADVEQLVQHFAELAAASERGFKRVDAELSDLEVALGRIPDHLYEALTLRGLKQLTNVEAAREARVHRNTMSRHYVAGLRWLRTFTENPRRLPQRRSVDWREWAQTNDDDMSGASEQAAKVSSSGRPPQIPREVDGRVLRLHCAGSTEREIARTLNAELPRPAGDSWTRSSVRSVLRRYGAPKRPRGRRPQLGTHRVGRSNYREIEFGEPLCDPDELLLARQRTPVPTRDPGVRF